MSRLARDDVQILKAEVQKLYATGNFSQRELANLFNKAPSQIARWTKEVTFENKEMIKKRRKFLFGS